MGEVHAGPDGFDDLGAEATSSRTSASESRATGVELMLKRLDRALYASEAPENERTALDSDEFVISRSSQTPVLACTRVRARLHGYA